MVVSTVPAAVWKLSGTGEFFRAAPCRPQDSDPVGTRPEVHDELGSGPTGWALC
jgi:hypothetical protein